MQTKQELLGVVQQGLHFGLEIYFKTGTCRVRITSTDLLLKSFPENISAENLVFKKKKTPQIRLRFSGGGSIISSESDTWKIYQEISKNIKALL
jgi:hypothetical protein